MNVLLVRPDHPYAHALSFGEQTYPIGLGFLLSVLREEGHGVVFVDRYLVPDGRVDLDVLRANSIDVAGVYMCSITFRSACRILAHLQVYRERGEWRGKLVVGGPHASLRPESVPTYVDHVVVGEGERALADIVAGRCTDRIIRYPRIKDLDSLPFPAFDIFAKMPYCVRFAMMDKGPLVNINTSRGCPYACRFCSVDAIWGRRLAYFSAERVVDDVERLHREFGFQAVCFREDNFLLNRQRALDIASLLATRQIGVKWGCEARVTDLQDEGFVAELAAKGLVHVFLGVESLSQRVLELMDKRITLEQIDRAVALCRKCGVVAFGSFVIGVPGETEEEMWQTVDGARAMFPERLYTLNTFMGIPCSEMYEEAINAGEIDYLDEVSGFFYVRRHNTLMEISLGGPVPINRQSPALFVGDPENVNNMLLGSMLEGADSAVEFVAPGTQRCLPDAVAYQGVLDTVRRLDGEGRYKVVALNNMLHLVHRSEFDELLVRIKSHLEPGGTLVGITRDRGEQVLGEAVMRNTYADYVYTEDELLAALSRAGFAVSTVHRLPQDLIRFEAVMQGG